MPKLAVGAGESKAASLRGAAVSSSDGSSPSVLSEPGPRIVAQAVGGVVDAMYPAVEVVRLSREAAGSGDQPTERPCDHAANHTV